MASWIEVKEEARRVVSKDGAVVVLHNVTAIDNGGTFLRLKCDEGYVLVNTSNVLAYIIKGDITL